MNSWPAISAQDDITTWTISELRRGDLIFCARSSGWLAFAGSVADEPWRHVGALSRDQDGDWVVLETVGDSFESRKLHAFVTAYETFGVARLDLAASCIDKATSWMYQKATGAETHVYAWDDLILAGIIAAAHRHIGEGQREQLRAALVAAAGAAKGRPQHRGIDSLTCSAFVQIAYDSFDESCAIHHDRWRTGQSWPSRHDSLDDLFEGPSAVFDDAVRTASLLDLFAQEAVVERSAAGSQPKVGQVWEMMRLFVYAVNGWQAEDEMRVADIGTDGRWVTPGDLWRSPTVAARGYVERGEALVGLARES